MKNFDDKLKGEGGVRESARHVLGGGGGSR